MMPGSHKDFVIMISISAQGHLDVDGGEWVG
jgi:hypothetical protein